MGVLKERFLDLLFPLQCHGCGREGALLCKECADSVPLLPPSCIGCGALALDPLGATCRACRRDFYVSVFYAPFSFSHGKIRDVICAFKYKRIRYGADPLFGRAIAGISHYRLFPPRDALVIPVGLHPARERTRGFNQAVFIAEAFADFFALLCEPRLLMRVRNTAPQVTLSEHERRDNMARSFRVRDQRAVTGRVCLLIDDVKTTGATLNAAAQALQEAGARAVWAFALAR